MDTATPLDIIKTIADILIPVIIFIIGSRLTKQREIADSKQQMIAQLSSLSEGLASGNHKRQLITLQILGHLKKTSGLPAELLNTVGGLALSDDPELAGTAQLILGGSDNPSDTVLLLELFAPIRAHLQRTKDAFKQWSGFNEALENEIMRGNKFIRDLLITKWYWIPDDLKKDSQALVEHYDAWLEEYERVRPNGLRDKSVPFVFVGPKGFPFPVDAEKRFLERYNQLVEKFN